MKKTTAICAFLLSACMLPSLAAGKAPAKKMTRAEINAKVAALAKESDKYANTTCWSTWLRYKWSDKSGKPKSQKDLDEMSEKYSAILKEISELQPTAYYKMAYANSLMFLKRYDLAEKLYNELRESCIAAKSPDPFVFAESEYHLAEIRLVRGDRKGAAEMLKTLLSRNLKTIRRGRTNWVHDAAVAYGFLAGTTYTALGLPVYTGAKAFPEAQKAEYTDDFAPLKDVAVRLESVKRDDPRVRLLSEKLKARGINCRVGGKGAYTVTLDLDAKAPVDKPEGYRLEIGRKSATVSARDMQGVLWGVVSFIQCLSDTDKAVRICKIDDWPSSARRGYLGGSIWHGCTEYTVFSKMNSVVMQKHPLSIGVDTPLNLFICSELAREFREFGLELYFGISNYTMGLGWAAYTLPGSLGMRIERCSLFAAMGANVYYPNDDMRYPVHKDDRAKGLNASDTDADHVLAVYNAVKGRYPAFRMIYCPPFYWGPDSSAAYPDDREKYLKSMRKLPPELDLYWTGGQVKGYSKSKRQVKWFTDLTGHKPAIFQNGTGPHNLLSYLADETDWNGWHYPGFFEEDITCFHKNSHTPGECVQITTLADCLWNVKAYDKKRSVKRALDILLGEKMYDILAPGVAALTAFDKYKYGTLTSDILYEDINELRRKYELASNCWQKAVAYNPTVRMYGAFGRGVGWAADVLKGAKNPPDFLKKFSKYLPEARKVAEKETGFDKSRGDILLLPTDMSGPQMFYYEHPSVTDFRFAKFIRGSDTQFAGTQFRFECDPFPPAGDYEIYICGMDDEVAGLNPIEIAINDKVIYSGPSGFEPGKYNLKKFTIPFSSMNRYNKLTIKNKAYGANPNGPPYIAVAYVMLRKTGEKKQ